MPIARFEMPDGRVARFEVPAGLSPEDAQNLISSSFLNKQPEAPKERTWGEVAKDVGVTTAKGIIGLPQAAAGILDIPTLGYASKGLESLGVRFADAQKILDQEYSPAQQEAFKKVEAAEGFVPSLKAMVQNPSVPAHMIGRSIPQMLGGAGIAKGLTKLIPSVGGAVAGGVGEGVLGAGSAAAQIREENPEGILTPKQSLAALGSGVGTAAFGVLGGKLAQRLGLDDIDTMLARGGPQAELAGQAKSGFTKSVIGSGISEGAFEELPQSVQEQMWQNWATDKPLDEGLGKAAATGLLTGSVAGGVAGGFGNLTREAPPPVQATQPSPVVPEAPQIDPDKYRSAIEQLRANIPEAGISDAQKIADIFKTAGIQDEAEISSYVKQATDNGDIKANISPFFDVKDAKGATLFRTTEQAIADKAAERLNAEEPNKASVTPVEITTLRNNAGYPPGYDIKQGRFKQQEFDIVSGDIVLSPKSMTMDDVDQKAQRLAEIRKDGIKGIDKEVKGLQEKVNQNNLSVESMEAEGQANTPEYATLSQQVVQDNLAIQKSIEELTAKKTSFTAPLLVRPAKASDEGFTVFQNGKPLYYFPTLEQAEETVDAAPTSVPTQEAIAAKEALRQTLLPFMKRVGLEGTGLRIMDSIESAQGSGDGYYAQNLIAIALSAPNPMATLRHETIHALKELGAFTDQEWKLLESTAKKDWINRFIKNRNTQDGKSLYEAYKAIYLQDKGNLEGFDSYITEEAIADAFKYFNANGTPPGMLSQIFAKIKAFLESLGNQFSGLGFQTADQVFKRVEMGQMRPTRAAPVGNAPRYEVVSLEGKRKDIFTDPDTLEAWKAIGRNNLTQLVAERFSTKSRDEAEREVYKKYLTKKDILEAARIQGDVKPSFTTEEGSAGNQYIQNLLNERSNDRYLDEIKELKKAGPTEMGRAQEAFGETVEDNRTDAQKARGTMAYNRERVEFLKKTPEELQDLASQHAYGVAYSDQAEGYQEAQAEGVTLSDAELEKIGDAAYKNAYEKELTRLQNRQEKLGSKREAPRFSLNIYQMTIQQKEDRLKKREDIPLSIVSANPGAGRYEQGLFTYKGKTLNEDDSAFASVANDLINNYAAANYEEDNTNKWANTAKERAANDIEKNGVTLLENYYRSNKMPEEAIQAKIYNLTNEKLLTVFNNIKNSINADFGPAQLPSVLQRRAKINDKTALEVGKVNIHNIAEKILKSNKSWIAKEFGLINLKFQTVRGSFEGNPELSFAMTADNMTTDIANKLSLFLGVGFVQDQVVHRIPIDVKDNNQFVIPSAIITNKNLSKVSEDDAARFIAAAKKAGLDYTEAVKGDGFIFHHFGKDSEINDWYQTLEKISQESGLNNVISFNLSSDLYDANLPQGYTSEGRKESGGQDRGEDVAAGSSVYAERSWKLLVDKFLAPYIKTISGQGYRVSPDRYATRYGLNQEQTDYLRKALYPKTAKGSIASILYDGEIVQILPSKEGNEKPSIPDVGSALANRSTIQGQVEEGDYSPRAAKAIAAIFADEVNRRIGQENIKGSPESLKPAKGWYERILKEALVKMSEVFPELSVNENGIPVNKQARFLFNGILAITSQGMDVVANFKAASVYYGSIRKESENFSSFSKINPQLAPNLLGDKHNAIELNLRKFQTIIDHVGGWEKAETLMLIKDKVNVVNKKISEDLKGIKFYNAEGNLINIEVAGAVNRISSGWSMFGPKIGSFANNLYGDYTTLTADLWFSRTWNRIAGFVFRKNAALEAKQMTVMRSAIEKEFNKTWRQTGAGEWKLTPEASAELFKYDSFVSKINSKQNEITKLQNYADKNLNEASDKLKRLEEKWKADGFTVARKIKTNIIAEGLYNNLKNIKNAAKVESSTIKNGSDYKIKMKLLLKEKKDINNKQQSYYSWVASSNPSEIKDHLNGDPDQLFDLANALYTDYAGSSFSRRTPLNNAAKAFFEGSSKLVAAPRSDLEGMFQQDVAEETQKILSKKFGLDVVIADIQALLWFEEKDIYKKFGAANSKAAPADYAEAAGKTIAGIKSGEINVSSVASPKPNIENVPSGGKYQLTAARINVDGVMRPTRNSRGAFIATTPEGIQNFWRWFGNSIMVDSKGFPRVMMHGTARDFERFMPKQAEAIFVTDEPFFAQNFSQLSEDWISKNYDDPSVGLTDEDIKDAQRETLSKMDDLTRREYGLNMKTNPQKFIEYGIDEWRTAILNRAETRANTVPLYVKLENPFNYQNKDHVKKVVDEMTKDWNGNTHTFAKDTLHLIETTISKKQLDGYLSMGDWGYIEHPETIAAIKNLDFDGITMREDMADKNYAVFKRTNVKSSVGNLGAFGQRELTQAERKAEGEREGRTVTAKEAKIRQAEGYIRYSISSPDTQPFKRWFKDSRVVDKDGNPLVMYHATKTPEEGADLFSVFNKSDDGKLGQGIYTTAVEKYAESFAPNGVVMPLWVSIQNPLYLDLTASIQKGRSARDILRSKIAGEEPSREVDYLRLDANGSREISNGLNAEIQAITGKRMMDMSGASIKRALQKAGYDGIIVRDADGNFVEVNAFDQTQIKSAIGNRGTYSESNKDIRYSLREKADELKAMSEAKRDEIAPSDFGYDAYILYEAEKLMPQKDGAFKKLNGNNSFILHNEADAIVNVDGNPFLAEAVEDPDNEDEIIWHFSDPKESSLTKGITTDFSDKVEAVSQLKQKLKEAGKTPVKFSLRDDIIDDGVTRFKGAINKYRVSEFQSFAALDNGRARNVFERIEDGIRKRLLADGMSDVKVNGMSPIDKAISDIEMEARYQADIRYSLRDAFDADFNATFGTAGNDALNRATYVRQEKGFAQRIAEAISPDSVTAIRQKLFNKYEAVERLSKMVAADTRPGFLGAKELLADVSANAAALQADRAAGVAAEALMNGIPVYEKGYTKVTDMGGKVKGLIPILEPLLKKYQHPKILQMFQFYSATRRGIRLYNEGREHVLTPADFALGKAFETKYPEFKTAYDEYQKFNEGLVKFLIDTGVLSKAMGAEWTKYGDYIPFYRQIDGKTTVGPKMFQNLSNIKITPELTGGDKQIGDYLETVVRNTRSAIEQGMKNVAAQRIVRDIMRLNTQGMNDMGRKLQPHEKSGSDVVTVRENGDDVRYQVIDPLLVESMKSLHNMGINSFWTLMSYPTQLLRNLVTKEPSFILANLARDSVQAWVTSGVSMTPLVDTFKQFGKVLANQSPEAKALRAAGIGTGYEFSGDIKSSAKAVADALNDRAGIKTNWQKAMWPVSKVWDALDKGSNASDLATRAEIYKKVLAETGNEAEAIYQSLEVMNFGRMGSSPMIQVISALVPFFNARVQGMDVLYRAGFGRMATQNSKAQHKAFMYRALFIAAMSSLYWFMARDTDEWKRASKETRDNYWLIGNVKIPIPFEIGVLFKVAPERILEAAFGNDTGGDLAESALRNIVSTLKINPVPQAFLPILEQTIGEGGFSLFTMMPIVGRGMENVAAPYQRNTSTTELSIMLGEQLNLSPIRIDHVISAYTGSMGMYMAQMIGGVINTVSGSEATRPAMSIEQTPVLKRFFASDKAGGTIDAFYSLKKEVDVMVRTQHELQSRGNPEQYAEYMEKNGQLLGLKGLVSSIDRQLTQFRELRNKIQFSSLDPQEKRETLDNIRYAEIAITENIKEIKKNVLQ